jgi:hypothetical protein
MKKINWLHLLILTSCVSVNLQKPVILEKSKFYSLATPETPFVRIDQQGMDQYWRNSKNGNAISLQTACSKNYDPSLHDLTFQTIQGIEDAKKMLETKFQYNERSGMKSEYHGTVDGIPVEIQSVTFKKNSCSYIISYFGKSTSIKQDQVQFETFIRNFRVK